MENNVDLARVVSEIRKVPGRIKGEGLRIQLSYIKEKEGEEGIDKLREKFKELKIPVDINNIGRFEWVDMWINSLIIIASKKLFNWSDDDVFQAGFEGAKFSFVNKVILSHFISIDSLVNGAASHWNKFFDFGSVEAEMDKEEKRVILKVKGLDFHPLQCLYLSGYLKGLFNYVIREDTGIKETKCGHRGDDHHEYVLEWK